MMMFTTGLNGTSGVTVDHLRCEYLENPLGIDILTPRLSWTLKSGQRGVRQSAYRIVVDGVWDSGKIESGESTNIPYRGPPLESGRMYAWKVQVWGEDGEASKWSEPAFWSMGLLEPDAWQDAEWIGFDRNPKASGFCVWKRDGR